MGDLTPISSRPSFRRRLATALGNGPSLRVVLVASGSLLLFALAYWLAFALRFDFRIPVEWQRALLVTLPWVLAVKLTVYLALGHFSGWWFYVTFADLVALLRAALLSLVILATIDHFIYPGQIPRAVLLMDCGVTIVLYGAVRGSGRLFVEHFRPALRRRKTSPALLVGVDRATGLLAHQINWHGKRNHRIRGLLSSNGQLVGQRLGQIPVLGHMRDVREIAATHQTKDILVIAGTLSGRHMRDLMETCQHADLTLRIIPTLENLYNGDQWIPLRKLEIGDLLHRPPMELDRAALTELLAGRRVLVTGAGGSIGSEICRQVLGFNPAELILLGRGENRIFAIERELRAAQTSTRLCPVIGCITDRPRMEQVFEAYRPEVVFHAAAHKHVPLMEANVGEAIKNNVLGTRHIADLADEFGSRYCALISTDKAVHPTSVLGATKLLAEQYVQWLATKSDTRFVTVRFGNVLGSAGSVVPIFQEQIRRGGPITITDPEMTRYFMTIPEASHLVLQATAMGEGGEIFVLDMGEPVAIVDLARDLIRLSGLPENAIDLSFTGIRQGEKLHERLYLDQEQTQPTTHPNVHQAVRSNAAINGVAEQIDRLADAVSLAAGPLNRQLREVVPEYEPSPVESSDSCGKVSS